MFFEKFFSLSFGLVLYQFLLLSSNGFVLLVSGIVNNGNDDCHSFSVFLFLLVHSFSVFTSLSDGIESDLR